MIRKLILALALMPSAALAQYVGPTLPCTPSGSTHAAGSSLPDTGVTAGTTKVLYEDCTWRVPGGGTSSTGLAALNLPISSGQGRFEFDFTDTTKVTSTGATDLTTSGNNLTFGTGSNAPTLVTTSSYPYFSAGLHFAGASAQVAQLPNAYKYGQAGTIYLVAHLDPIGSGQGSTPLGFYGSSNTTETNATAIYSFANPSTSNSTGVTYTATPYMGTALSPTGGTITTGYNGGTHCWAFVADASGVAGRVFMDGAELNYSQRTSLVSGGIAQPSGSGNYQFGGVPYPVPQYFSGTMFQLVGVGTQDNQFVVNTMCKKLLAYDAAQQLPMGYTNQPSTNSGTGDQLLVFADSLSSDNVGTVGTNQSWPYVLATNLGLGASNLTNISIPGTTPSDWIAAGPWIRDEIPTQASKPTMFFELGANNPSTAFPAAVAYAARGNSTAKLMVVGNPMGIGGDSSLNSLNIYNRANWPNYADYYCDVAESTILGKNGNETNATYWQQTGSGSGHLTVAGQSLKAGIITACYKALWGARALTPTSYTATATATAADNYIDIPPGTSAFTLTLQDGVGLTKLKEAPCSINISNRSSNTVTLATQNSETFNGSTSVAAGANACINIIPLAYATAGVSFNRVQ